MSEQDSTGPAGSHDFMAPVDVTSTRRRSLEATSGMPLRNLNRASKSWEGLSGSHELTPRERTRVNVFNVSGSLEATLPMQREPSVVESRIPRYQGGSYKSYEEMLANMDASDPFSGVAPPARQKSDIVKPTGKPPPRPPRPVSHLAIRNDGDKDVVKQRTSMAKVRGGHGSSDTRLKPSSGAQQSASSGRVEDTLGALNSSFVLDDSLHSFRRRPGSARSTGTYVIEEERRDSEAELIPAVQPTAVKLRQRVRKATTTLLSKKQRVVCRTRAPSVGFRLGGNESAISRYIQDHISQRQCKKFVIDLKKEDGRCQCGRTSEWHSEAGIRVDAALPANHDWRPDEEHTHIMDSTCFGTIQFKGFGQESNRYAPYVRVDYKTPPEVVWTLLSDYWRVPAPKLIISVTGGAKRFYMKNRLKACFKRGLVNAAKTTGAWIVTGGTNTGVMEFVGEATHDHALGQGSADQPVVALGIASWGIVDNKESLESADGHGLFPAVYHSDQLRSKSTWGMAPLDCNHTHFILVDDGTEKKFGKEIKFRASLEHYISESMETGIARNQSVQVPVVLLVLEGGENTLQTAAQEMMRNIPVVIIEGSGRAADFIAQGYRVTKAKDEDKSVFTSNFDADFKKHAEGVFDWSRVRDASEKAKKIARAVADLRTMLENRRLLTVYRQDEVDSSNEIDQAILLALLKANRSDTQTQLNLALAWNRCDVARTEIFGVTNRAQWQKINLHGAMATALVQNRVDFVQLFLDCGVSLSRFLTIRRLRDLYDDVVYDQYSGNCAALMRNQLQWTMNMWKSGVCCACCHGKERDDTSYLLYAVGDVITYLFGGQHGNIYKDDRFVVHGLQDKEHNMESMLTTITSLTSGEGLKQQRFQPELENPERELFLWAVLLNRQELANLFWKLGQDHIGAALYGSTLLKALALEADFSEEIALSTELMEHSSALEEKAVGVLTECYQRDKVMAHQLLVREVPTWGNSTLLEFADAAQQMDFINHASVQTILNRIWCGKMALYTATWKIIGSMVLPFLVAWMKFSPYDFYNQKSEGSHNESFENYDIISENSVKLNCNQVDGGDKGGGEGCGDGDDVHFVHSKPQGHETVRKGHLFTVGCCGDPHLATISFFKALYYYHTAPVTKFMYHTLSYLVFLLVFSYLMMIELSPGAPGRFEYLVWGWVATFIMEELRQMLTMKPASLSAKFQLYFRNIWNRFDTAVHGMLVLCILLRYTVQEKDFQYPRMLYAGTLVLYYLRFLHNFYSAKNIGPKVIMIRRMMTDLIFFLAILVLMIIAYGVATQSLRYPNSQFNWGLVRNILYYSYWQMYGELFLEELEGGVSDCSSNATVYENDPSVVRCPERPVLVILLLVFYMIMTNVLLLNILIAMFSYTFQQVQDNSEKVWRFYRYSLIYEFFDKPTLPPPFIIFSILFHMVKYMHRYCGSKRKANHDFCQSLSPEANKRLAAFERVGMEDYLFKIHRSMQDLIDVKVHSTGEKLEKVIENLEHIREQVSQTVPEPAGVIETLLPFSPQHSALSFSRYESDDDLGHLRQRITGIEEQLNYHSDQMGQLLEMVSRLVDKQQRPTSPTVTPTAWAPDPQIASLEPQVKISDASDSNAPR